MQQPQPTSSSSSSSATSILDAMQEHYTDHTLYHQVVGYAMDYLQAVREQRIFPDDDAITALARFDEPMPDVPHAAADVLAMLHEVVSPATVAQMGGRYFGFVNGGAIPTSLAARWLADVWDQNAALHVTSPISAKLEHLCEIWIVDLLGLPEGTAAGFVSGTSTATMCGLLAGRNALLAKQGWDVNENGLFGAPPIRVVMSEGSHGTVRKGLSILGIGRQQIEWIPADEQGRFDVTHLPEVDNNTLVILQAGNVNSGSFDPFVPICEAANKADAWVHIDGAFGLCAAFSDSTRHLTKGIELANSWSVDGHKTLNTPYDSGIVLCADRSALTSALQSSGSYIQFSEERDGMLYTPEFSRRARGVEMWALLKSLGRSGVDALIAQLCRHAQHFAHDLAEQGFRILNDVVFNQVLVACDTPEMTQATLQAVQKSGECWCGGSQWHSEPVIRISVCSWATTTEDVNRSVAAFVKSREEAK
jgi:glutamate/tyrosine decarboxylase-like PLP-dependent enzyme